MTDWKLFYSKMKIFLWLKIPGPAAEAIQLKKLSWENGSMKEDSRNRRKLVKWPTLKALKMSANGVKWKFNKYNNDSLIFNSKIWATATTKIQRSALAAAKAGYNWFNMASADATIPSEAGGAGRSWLKAETAWRNCGQLAWTTWRSAGGWLAASWQAEGWRKRTNSPESFFLAWKLFWLAASAANDSAWLNLSNTA